MKRTFSAFALGLLWCSALWAQGTPARKTTASPVVQGDTHEAADAPRLPIRRVVLYKNGVGYFEHLGRVRGSQDVHVDFTSAQLNDVLKSLTVLDLSGGRISGVDYNSEAPLARRLSTLRLALGENPTLAEFLAALRGSRLEVRTGGSAIAGRLLGVEQKSRVQDAGTTEWTEISLVGDAGEVRSVQVTPATGIRVVEKDLQTEVGRYLSLVASSREQDLRRMTISASGSGDRNLYVSYISEVPIWKTTYRIILPGKADKKPMLQGWAIVDNTIGEDWNDVELSLVAGAPHSFIQQLSQPYYGRRPVVPLPESVQLTPQTHAATLESSGSGVGRGNGDFMVPKLSAPGGIVGGVAGGSMGGVIGGVIGGVGAAPPPAPPMPDEEEVENAEAESEPAAEGSPVGDLFEYKLKDRVTIHKNQSALVPILQSDIAVDRVSLWSESMNTARPLRALWVNNTSSLTLDGGSFAVLDGNTFAGEGLIESIKPGERRLLSYATDLGVVVDAKLESGRERVTRVRIFHGTLTTTSEMHEQKTYIARNEDLTAKLLIIEHPARPDWKLADGGSQPEEKAVGLYRFRLNIEPKKTERLVVRETKPLYARYELNDVTAGTIEAFRLQKSINPEIEAALHRVLDQKAVVADLDSQLKAQQKTVDQIFADQARLRENIKALKGSAEERALLQRYTKQLDEQETELDARRKKMQETQSQRDLAIAVLQKMIQELQLDVTL